MKCGRAPQAGPKGPWKSALRDPNGATHPAWIAVALDRDGNKVAAKGEPLVHSGMQDVQKELDADGQSSVRKLSDEEKRGARGYAEAVGGGNIELEGDGIMSVRILSDGSAGKTPDGRPKAFASYSAVLLHALTIDDGDATTADIKCPSGPTPNVQKL